MMEELFSGPLTPALEKAVNENGNTFDDAAENGLADVVGVLPRFGIATLLVVTVLYSVLFGILQLLELPPVAFAEIVLFFTAVGLGQAFLFKGRGSRLASMVVGAILYPCLWVGGVLYLMLWEDLPLPDDFFRQPDFDRRAKPSSGSVSSASAGDFVTALAGRSNLREGLT